jgi:hypothetical protein
MAPEGEQPISDTRFKLNEAKYFLDQMIANVENHDNFEFNLSAFASASRSVTFVMEAEFKKDGREPFRYWYKENVTDALHNEHIPKFFKDLGDMLVKQNKSPSQVLKIVSRIMVARYDIMGAENENKDEKEELKELSFEEPPPETTSALNEKPAVKIDPTKAYVWYFPRINDKSEPNRRYVIKSCQYYHERLSGLVDDCELQFFHQMVNK